MQMLSFSFYSLVLTGIFWLLQSVVDEWASSLFKVNSITAIFLLLTYYLTSSEIITIEASLLLI